MFCSQQCVDVLKEFSHTSGLRHYSEDTNDTLHAAVAAMHGLPTENIYLSWGSAPALKAVLRLIMESVLIRSPLKLFRHFVFGDGYPFYTPQHTWLVVPKGMQDKGIHTHFLPLCAGHGFRLDVPRLHRQLSRRDGWIDLYSQS